MTPSQKTIASSLLLLSVLINSEAEILPSAQPISFIPPIVDSTYLSYSQRINLVTLYIDLNHGKAALTLLAPLMRGTPRYPVLLLAAQCYAELDNPIESLKYYQLARKAAYSSTEIEIAEAGLNKMGRWLKESNPSWLFPIDTLFSSYQHNIQLIKQFVSDDKGAEALNKISPILTGIVSYDLYLLTAQAYAELEKPELALHYYRLAQTIAHSDIEIKLSQTGIIKMQQWIIASKQKRHAHHNIDEVNACKGIAIDGTTLRSCSQKVRQTRRYLSLNQGARALHTLEPLLTQKASFDVRILAAQAYSEKNQPRQALLYYKSALAVAHNTKEQTIALYGMGKMQFWLGNYYAAIRSYQDILKAATQISDFEPARAGLVKSLAYADRPILGYQSIPKDLMFTTPDMVIAASQAALWADQADIALSILTKYEAITQHIDPQSTLGRDLQDLQWQVVLSTHPNVVTPTVFYSEDSEHFSVLRSTMDYTHYWSQQYQSSVGVEYIRYTQNPSLLNAKGVYIREQWRPTRQLIINGTLEPTNYELWNPLLGNTSISYRPTDYIGTQLLVRREVVETFPAFAHHITDEQYAASLFVSPLPYVKINGSLSRLNLSDSNVRQGYYIATTAVLSTALGLNLTVQKRGYTDKFVSPYYFSPNQYSATGAILRIGSKTKAVWHYYIDAGLGTQDIWVKGSPKTSSPTDQYGFGLRGPIGRYLVLNTYYAISHQASAFIGTPKYTYQYGSISLNVLI